ncbi:hypothetical protein [Mucilaginibacter segetis]|uniref:hypothetical protein n=1 Tax=Mucilaginibacter segetis TaxID=2793071 RepID=UPI00293D43F0|nr:hypothetical protein [Mucilaginibacter segetis]
MEYIRFGNTGMMVSRLCLGTMTYGMPTERWPWALNEEQSRPLSGRPLTWVSIFLIPRTFTRAGPVKKW